MPGQVLLESSYGLGAASSRVQADRIDIGISRPVGLKFGCSVQFLERFIWPFQSYQHQSKRVVKPCIVWS